MSLKRFNAMRRSFNKADLARMKILAHLTRGGTLADENGFTEEVPKDFDPFDGVGL